MSQNGLSNRIWTVSIAIFLILQVSCAPSGPVITIETSPSALQVNNTTRTSVLVANIADLTAYEVHLSFDASALEVLELRNGTFIKADFIVQNTFDNFAGTIDYAAAQIDFPAANGSGTLLEIVFRAKTQGKFPIRFRETPAVPEGVLLSDSSGTAIPTRLVSGIIEVGR